MGEQKWLVVVASLVVLSLSLFDVVAAAACKTVTTFNTALTPRVKEYWSRRGLMADALAAESADVLCLQELWYEDDMRHLIEDLKSIYPHHFSGIHDGINDLDVRKTWFAKSACSFSELWSLLYRLLPCAIRQGCIPVFAESSEAGLGCLAAKCGDVLRHEAIDANCVTCLVLSSASFSDVRDRCYRFRGDDLRLNPAGLMVFSKTPLAGQPKTFYKTYYEGKNQTLHRGYIQTEVQDIGTVVCTHLTSVFPHYWEYDLDFGSYKAQNQEEIRIINASLSSTDHLVAADFNTGPAVSSDDPEKNLNAEAPENHALLRNFGYDVQTYLSDDGRCTYCSENKITSPGYNNVIDDVLVKGNHFTSVTKQRVLDQNNPPLSDHYGVRARVCNN